MSTNNLDSISIPRSSSIACSRFDIKRLIMKKTIAYLICGFLSSAIASELEFINVDTLKLPLTYSSTTSLAVETLQARKLRNVWNFEPNMRICSIYLPQEYCFQWNCYPEHRWARDLEATDDINAPISVMNHTDMPAFIHAVKVRDL